MREIKFRAFIPRKGIMDYEPDYSGVSHILNDSFKSDTAYECDAVWMQYIGLKDKNGKEIYESDFVDHPNGIKVVNWVDSLAAFDMGMSNFVSDQEMSMCYMDEITVIGNIYENPELLNE